MLRSLTLSSRRSLLLSGHAYIPRSLHQRHLNTNTPAEAFTPQPDTVTVVFQDSNGTQIARGCAKEGQSILDVAHVHKVDLEGACESSLACSTCHVVLEPSAFELFEPPTAQEHDMLDLASGLTETSRLGCQVKLSKKSEGIKVIVPGAKPSRVIL